MSGMAGSLVQHWTPEDEEHMRRALDLARGALGWASPNPAVGCVLVRDEEIVGEGCTEPYGGLHAERVALRAAGADARGATAYVTLAPCAHQGKTPPCTDALLEAGVVRVVAGMPDPNPESLDGAEILRAGGVCVEVGCLADEALAVVAGFVKCLRSGLPYLCYKYAMTADGRLATRTGHSRWISGPAARAEVQGFRREADAVMVGIGTVLADDPRLNVRPPESAGRPVAGHGAERVWQPRRVVVDAACRTPAEARLLAEAGGTVTILTTEAAPEERRRALAAAGASVLAVAADADGRVDLQAGLRALAEAGVRSILCEGGPTLAGALYDEGLIDEVIVYLASLLIGGREAPGPLGGVGAETMAGAAPLWRGGWTRAGDDLRLRGRVGNWNWAEDILSA
jgi:diaminohydroxyphosphoribosylaminopyrimidine deaminase/5-amino-6-(5-phosphoribosylamino)uracil reductase